MVYLQFEFGSEMLIREIHTQGNQIAQEWVRSFRLSYSRDGLYFTKYQYFQTEDDKPKVCIHGIIMFFSFFFFNRMIFHVTTERGNYLQCMVGTYSPTVASEIKQNLNIYSFLISASCRTSILFFSYSLQI